jgi:hypothetical protein
LDELGHTREQNIHFILIQRHGAGGKHAEMFTDLGFTNGPRLPPPSPVSVSASLKAEAALEALSESELDIDYECAKREAAAKEEVERWYNRPDARADFIHWANTNGPKS